MFIIESIDINIQPIRIINTEPISGIKHEMNKPSRTTDMYRNTTHILDSCIYFTFVHLH